MAEIEELKGLFGTEALTYEQFNQKVAAQGGKINLANLAGGGYISTERHNRELDEARKSGAGVPADYEELKAKAGFEQKYNELVAQNTRRERLAAVTDATKAGATVKPEFAEFVLAEVEKDPESKTKFEDTLKKYVKEHPQYTQRTRKVVQIGSGTHEDGGEGGGNAQNGFFNDFILGQR